MWIDVTRSWTKLSNYEKIKSGWRQIEVEVRVTSSFCYRRRQMMMVMRPISILDVMYRRLSGKLLRIETLARVRSSVALYSMRVRSTDNNNFLFAANFLLVTTIYIVYVSELHDIHVTASCEWYWCPKFPTINIVSPSSSTYFLLNGLANTI